jgi:hypothetical protein
MSRWELTGNSLQGIKAMRTVIDIRCRWRKGKKEKRRFNHVVDNRGNIGRVMAFGIFDECGRRFDSRPIGHRNRGVLVQCAEWPTVVDLASQLGIWAPALKFKCVK